MDIDYVSLLALVLVLLLPAVVVFGVMTAIRIRRGRFHRQRITKGSRSHSE